MQPKHRPLYHQILPLMGFLALMLGGGALIGTVTGPDPWYAALRKPHFTPPNWVFAPVWSVLYVLIAVAGWRLWRSNIYPRPLPTTLWWTQLVLNFLWSPLFFQGHAMGLAMIDICALLAVIVVFIIDIWRSDRVCSWLFAPYAAWVAFATALNAGILLLNR